MDIEKILKLYADKTIIKQDEDFAIAGLPFFHLGNPESIAIRFSQNGDDIVVSDCRTTTKYLDEKSVDLNDYREKLAVITQKFNVTFDDGVFRKIIYNSQNDIDLLRGIGYFIEAIILIAHIDL